ncbi:hypothetical protein ACU8LZ_12510 [Rhizobium leguminosarum]
MSDVLRTNQSPMVDFVMGEKYLFTDPIDKAYDSIRSPFPTSIVPTLTDADDLDKKFSKVLTRPVLGGQNVNLSIIPETFDNAGLPDFSFAYSLVGMVDTICDASKQNGDVIFSLTDHIEKSKELSAPLSLIFDVSTRKASTSFSFYLTGIITPILQQLLGISPPTDDLISKYDTRYCPPLDPPGPLIEVPILQMLEGIGQLRQNISASLDAGESWPTPDALFKESKIVPVKLIYRNDFTPNIGDDRTYFTDRWTGGIIVKLHHHKDIGDLVLVRGRAFGSDQIQVGIVAVRDGAGERLYGCVADKELWPK